MAEAGHEEWEKHGAAVIPIPDEWTPQGFWRRWGLSLKKIKELKQKSIPKEQIGRVKKIWHIDEVPSDHQIVDFLVRSGFDVPVLNLHGTPYGVTFEGYEDEEGKHPKEVISPTINFMISYQPRSRIGNPESFPYGPGFQLHPNEVLCEYYFGGKRSKSKGRLLRPSKMNSGKNAMPESNLLKILESKTRPDMSPAYLGKPTMTPRALERYKREFAPLVTEVIQHLARHGLEGSDKP